MGNTIPKKQMDNIIAEVMQNHVADIRGLLTFNGVVDASGFGDDDTRIAFLKAMKDSASFRTDLAGYMSNLVQTKASFVGQPQLDYVAEPMAGFVNQPMLGFGPISDEPAATTTTTPAKSGGGFWGALGGLASKDNLQSLFNTGLGAASNALQNKANKDSEERALELERLRLQQIQAQKDLAAAGGGVSKGLSTGAWIGIGIGAVVLITVIVLVARKK